jgi:hypothetical protein
METLVKTGNAYWEGAPLQDFKGPEVKKEQKISCHPRRRPKSGKFRDKGSSK